MENLNQLTVKELKQICRDENHRGFSKLRKAELILHIIDGRANKVVEAKDSNMTEDEFDRMMFANSVYADEYSSYEEWKTEDARQRLESARVEEAMDEWRATEGLELNRAYLERCFNLPTHVYDAREIDTEVKKINDLMQRQQLERCLDDNDELDEEDLKLCQQFVDELVEKNRRDDLPF